MLIKDVVEKRVHVLVCTSSGGGPLLVGGICATPLPRVDPCPPCNGKRQGRVCLNRGPNCFDVSRPAVPGGARHTWGLLRQPSIIQSARNCFYTNSPPSSTYTSNRANLAAKLEQRLRAILILGDWINLCKLRLQCNCICI